jgi:hypothetical protein
MKDANRVVRDFVLRSISDDYENVDKILEDVGVWGADQGVSPARDEVLRALEGLLREGYAEAFAFEYPFKEAVRTEYSSDLADSLWFYVTPTGKRLAHDLQAE